MKAWRNAIVKSDDTMEKAIQVLEKASVRIALITGESDELQGTLTDGDVRRALLKHLPLDTPVSQIMNTHPLTAQQSWEENRLLATMERYELLYLPIVDDEGRVTGLAYLHEILNSHRRHNPVFLMAGGFGKRLSPLTDNCPKPLLKVGDKPILETILEGFIQNGFYRFYISTHYKHEMITDYFGDGSKWGVEIKYVHEDSPLGTGGALGLLPKDIEHWPLLVMNGDIMTKVDYAALLDYHNTNNGVATMCVREYEYQVPYGVVETAGNSVIGMAEKPVYKFFVNAGIYVISRELVDSIKPNSVIDMPTLLEKQIQQEKLVSMFPLYEYWLDVGKMNDFERAQQDFYKGFSE